MEAHPTAPASSDAHSATPPPEPAPFANRTKPPMQPASIAASPPGPAAAAAGSDSCACASAAEALAAARDLLHQLRWSHAQAEAAAEAHRREREGLMHQLQAIQVGGSRGGAGFWRHRRLLALMSEPKPPLWPSPTVPLSASTSLPLPHRRAAMPGCRTFCGSWTPPSWMQRGWRLLPMQQQQPQRPPH